jgi:cation:H+ antiporter
VAYTLLAFRQERAADGGALHDKESALEALDPGLAPRPARGGGLLVPLLLTLAGLALVIGGGAALVRGAVALAQSLAIPETVIGLTIVAVGTSMPELVTSVMAALRRQGDVAFGNIVGSNIINILGIGGVTALIAPVPVPAAIAGFDAPVMLGVTVLMVLVAATGLRVSRREGALLLAGYAAYLALLWP